MAPASVHSDAVRARAWDQLWSLLTRPIPDDEVPPQPAPDDDEAGDADEAAA